MGVAGVVLALGLAPGVAAAQDYPAGPTITISLAENSTFNQNDPIVVTYSCASQTSTVTQCAGDVPSGGQVDTSTAGPHTFTVNARDAAGATSSATRHYNVVVSSTGPIGGQTPSTLVLTLGQPSSFAPMIPGVTQSYLASLAATVTSTAGDATLTVADPGANPGHLVNGSFVLPSALQAGATHGSAMPSAFSDIGGSDSPTTLLTYDGPATNDPVTIGFKQAIAATDTLRTGAYTKTFTFTLSTTNP
jgi:hypothetical protein